MIEWLSMGGVGLIALAFSHWLAYELGRSHAERQHRQKEGDDAEELARLRSRAPLTQKQAMEEARRTLRRRERERLQSQLQDDS